MLRRVPLTFFVALCALRSMGCGGDVRDAPPSDDEDDRSSSGASEGTGAAGTVGGTGGGTGGTSGPAGGTDTGGMPGLSTGGQTTAGGMGGEPPTQEELRERALEVWNENQSLPEDPRPVGPEWDPPFDLGEPGFGDSDEPLCTPFEVQPRLRGFGADSRGVFVAITRYCDFTLDRSTGCDPVSGHVVFHNAGQGWKALVTPADGLYDMHLVEEGPLLLSTLESFPAKGRISFDPERGTRDAATFLPDPVWPDWSDWEDSGGGTVTVFGQKEHAFLNYSYTNSSAFFTMHIARLSDGAWQRIVDVEGDLEVTTDPEGRLYFWDEEHVAYYEDDWIEIPALRTTERQWWRVWPESPDDVWVLDGSLAPHRLLHFVDGTRTVVREFGSGNAVLERAGADMYFLDGDTFGVIRDDEATVLASGVPFSHMATTDDGDVFLLVTDRDFVDSRCGHYFVLHYDGTEFHRF